MRSGYNEAATSYFAARDKTQNTHHLQRFTEILPPPAAVLDVGCGAGDPIALSLTDLGYKVTGIDISPKQIELASRKVPKGRFEVRDMLEIRPSDYLVDGLVSFYSIIHTQRDRHSDLLKTFASFLRPGGVLLITMGAEEWEGREEFHGVEMYWSHFGAAKNRALVEQAGFNVLIDEIDTSANERHQIILAVRE